MRNYEGSPIAKEIMEDYRRQKSWERYLASKKKREEKKKCQLTRLKGDIDMGKQEKYIGKEVMQ